MNAEYMNVQSLSCIGIDQQHIIGQRNPSIIYSENSRKVLVMSSVAETLGPLFEASVNGDSDADAGSNNYQEDDSTKCTEETSNSLSHDDTIIKLQDGSSRASNKKSCTIKDSFDGRWKPGVRRKDCQSLSSASDHGIPYNTRNTSLTNRSSTQAASDPVTTIDSLPTKPKRRGSDDFLSDSDSSEEQIREKHARGNSFYYYYYYHHCRYLS